MAVGVVVRANLLAISGGIVAAALFGAVAVTTVANDPPAPLAPAAGFAPHVQLFTRQHCQGCHGPEKAKAGFRIDQLSGDFTAPKVADQWKDVLDRINAGEMPPKSKPRPDAKDSAAFVGWIDGQLRQIDQVARNAGGRIPMRRMNRDEYANTVRDLLHLDENVVRPLAEDLPSDGKAEGFDRLGVALFFDQTQVERSLSVASKIAAHAIVTQPPMVNRFFTSFQEPWKRKEEDLIEAHPSVPQHKVPRGAHARFVKPDVIEYIQGGPTYVKEYDGWGSIDHNSISAVVTRDGYYRVRIKATVDNRARTEPNKFRLIYGQDSPIETVTDVPIDPSGTTEALLFLRGPDADGEVKGPQIFRVLWNHTEKAVIHDPAYIKAVYALNSAQGDLERAATRRAPEAEMAALRKKREDAVHVLETWQTPAYINNPAMDVEKLPRLLIKSIEVEGPIQKEWPPTSHKSLFFAGDDRSDVAYAREIVARFLPRAYRRPVTAAEIDGIVAVVEQAMTTGKQSFPDAMRLGLQRILCAPSFLFLGEPAGANPKPRPLTDYELASRLSYFLWSTMPDEELFALAAANKLHEAGTLAAQVKRMLADAKAQQFVRNFGGQWLAVREFGAVQPAAEYKDYDKALEQAAKQEPYAFVAEVVASDLPITSFIDSDFVTVNERLARHYAIDGVKGPQFRRVAIEPRHHRGGVLGMAGLMTYLADGTRTLPMRRGSWVLRELFNDPPGNPPPNAGEIQPNTSGKNLTVRQRLEKHRGDEVCASCHAKLDPYGLALENYDAIGAWRERANGEGIRGPQAPLLDVSGTFPDGTKFATLQEYKAALLAQKDKFARAFSSKLLTYALGRPVVYTDHETLDALMAALKKDEYRIRSLIVAIVRSEPFQTK